MLISVPVSIGELVDKITILRIKTRMITNIEKLNHINTELAALQKVCAENKINLDHSEILALENINEKLWKIEDDIRKKEKSEQFDAEFIRLARSVYFCNDERFRLKSAVNQIFGSAFREEKSYQDYGTSVGKNLGV